MRNSTGKGANEWSSKSWATNEQLLDGQTDVVQRLDHRVGHP